MKLKDIDISKLNVQWQRKDGSILVSVDDTPKPLKKKSPAEIRNNTNTSRNNFYRSARTPGLGN